MFPYPWSRLGKQQPALTFVDNGLVAVLGRQVAGKPVEGFPNGLPALTPLGVRLKIKNMLYGQMDKKNIAVNFSLRKIELFLKSWLC